MSWFQLNWQWWWYEIRKNGYHERTYMKRSDAIGFADVSQKIRGGDWTVLRKTQHGNVRIVAAYNGIRHE